MQNVVIFGRLGRDPETRQAGEHTVASFSVAVADGKDRTTWFNVETWDKTADIAARFLKKGSPVLIEGRMRCDQYEKDGEKKINWKLVGNRITLMPRSSSGEDTTPENVAPPKSIDKFEPTDDDIPF